MATDKQMKPRINRMPSTGFSLVELLVVVVMISIAMVAILAEVDQVQQRATTEQGRVDDFQQARDFIAQVTREGRRMGYPNVHNYDTSATPAASPCSSTAAWQTSIVGGQTLYINDCRMAVGLIKVTNTELDFGGDIDGTGAVSIVSYKLNGDGNCAKCMERAKIAKVNAQNPLTQVTGIGASSYVTQVQNVQNGSSAVAPIFSAYNAAGSKIILPRDITTDPTIVPTIRLIKMNLAVANPNSTDARTGKQLEADLTGNIQVVNCSMATTGLSLSSGLQLTCQ